MTRDRLLIFIATYNRIDTLARTIASFRTQTGVPYEVVIIDNGTDDHGALAMLAALERLPEVRTVYSLATVDSMEALTDNYNVAIADQYDALASTEEMWFAVTDPDICFDASDSCSFAAYLRLARRTGNAVGPHTRVDTGIPLGYPLRSRVLTCESRLLYRETMNWYEGIPYSAWAIDTTFHLFPAVREHRRLHLNTLRVGPPYDATHLDWYLDIFNPTAENAAYIPRGPGGIGSWGRSWIADFWWRFQEDREKAWRFLLDAPTNRYDDLDNTAFVRAWGYQVGLGGEPDLRASVRELYAAVPPRFRDYWKHRHDWLGLIYRGDDSCLGWTEELDAVAA